MEKNEKNISMKLRFLGTAAATSMPLVFCNCEICKQARINKGKDFRKRASAVINNEMLIDLSPDLCSMANLYDIDLGKIKYLLQTHSHSDHFDGGHFITRWSEYATRNLTHLDIFCSNGTANDINHWVNEEEPTFDLFDKNWQKDMNYQLHILKHNDSIKYNNYEIRAINSLHDDRIESLVYIISSNNKKILYGTDLLEISLESWNILKEYKLDLVILDQTYGEGFNNGGHLDAGKVVNIINKMKKENIINENTLVYATHISHEGNNTHEKMEKEAIQNGYHIAYDGLEIQL